LNAGSTWRQDTDVEEKIMGCGDELLELFRKRLLVEEDPRVVVFAVEPIL